MNPADELRWVAAVLTERADVAEAQNKIIAVTGCTGDDVGQITVQAEALAARTGQNTSTVLAMIADAMVYPMGPHR